MMKTILNSVQFFLVLALVAGQANAQFVVKRMKCADEVTDPDTIIYSNQTGSTKHVTLQVVRDSCRPKDNQGAFSITAESSVGSAAAGMIRTNNKTAAHSFPVINNVTIKLNFVSLTASSPKGTFDYVLTVE